MLCAGNLQPSDPACAPGNALVKTCQDLSRGKTLCIHTFLALEKSWKYYDEEGTKHLTIRTQPLVSVHEALAESLKPCHAGFHQTSGLWYLGVSRQGMAKIPSTPKICLAGVCLAQVNWAQKDVAPSEGTEKTRSEGCRLWGWFLDSQFFEANQRIGTSKLWPQKNWWDKERFLVVVCHRMIKRGERKQLKKGEWLLNY